MNTNVNIPSKESIAFNNYEENQINFDVIAKICVEREFIVKFPSVLKQKKINSKPKVDIKIPLPKKKVVAHCDKIDYIKLDKCISKLLECSSKMKQYEKESLSFSVKDMICSSNKVLGVKRRRDIKEKRNQRMKIAKEEETINYSNTQNSSNNNTGNESNIGRKVLFKII